MSSDADQNSPWHRVYKLAGTAEPSRKPVPHQHRALGKMTEWYKSGQHLGGILVLPTGGGKSFAATYFLCRHPLSEGYHILWLAHTHHLLEQALDAFDNTIPLVDKSEDEIGIRVVSGATGHFKPADIDKSDNILLCSLQTATRALENRHEKFMDFLDAANDGAGLFVVFDEAHHTPAPSYRKLLTGLRERCKPFGLLGLTATPTYSDERKRGWLKRLFPQGIVAQEDARTLMAEGVLAKPILEDVRTEVKPRFDEKDYRGWVSKYRDLPEQIIGSLAENQSRNDSIVAHYVNNKEKYGKTIMFASRWFQCEYLSEALRKKNVRADAVYSRVESTPGGAEVRNRRRTDDNADTIKRFKNDELDVLINVQMLTEGTDVPGAKTVFLTRQTTSEILLKQMVGRALRGPKFEGTKDAHVVSFIDDWQQHIDWATYNQIIEESISEEQPKYSQRPQLQLVSTELVQRLARQMDRGINVNTAPYMEIMPVGWYRVEYDAIVSDNHSDGSPGKDGDDIGTVHRLIMVYDRDHEQLERFISRLQDVYNDDKLQGFEHPDLEMSRALNKRLRDWHDEMFDNDRPNMTKHLLDLTRHVAQQDGERPAYFEFDQRKDHDLDVIAKRCIDESLSLLGVDKSLRSEYARGDRLWQNFYGKYDLFKSASDACINRILNTHDSDPDDGESGYVTPTRYPLEEPSDEIKEWVKARDQYRCLCCGGKTRLEVDHIKPKYRSRSHKRENLQTLCSICNRLKGDSTMSFRYFHRHVLTRRPKEFPDVPIPDHPDELDQWKQYLQRSVNLFYRCSAVCGIDVTIKEGRFWSCSILLCWGHNDDWLRTSIPKLFERIEQVRVKSGCKGPREIEINVHSKQKKDLNNSRRETDSTIVE